MIIVSGEARSGTSVMMLILKKLGFKIAGSKVINPENIDMNPTGIWEVKEAVTKPFTQETIDKYQIEGEAMKVISHALFTSDWNLIDTVIYMVRDPREIIVSQRRQINAGSDEHNYGWYNVHMGTLLTGLEMKKYPPMLFVDYGKLMTHPKAVTKKVAQVLGRKWSAKVAKAVNKKYYRSKAEDAPYDETAMMYYKYFKALCV